MISISIIILNYNTPDLIEDLVLSLGNDPFFEIIIIDNSDSHAYKKSGQDNVHIYQSKDNLGFAKGVNLGTTYAKGEWLLFLNSCNGDCLNNRVSYAKEPFSIVFLTCNNSLNCRI